MKRSLVISILAALVVVAFIMPAGWLQPARAAQARTGTLIGAGSVGQHAFEFIGKIDQNGASFTTYGYLTYLRGLSDSVLFTDPTKPSEATARFTFYGQGTLISRNVLGTLFVLTTTGGFAIYASSGGGATFGTPTSFQQGTAITTLSVRQQSIVNVQAPNQGILNIMGQASHKTARAFSLLGKMYRMGRVGQREQITATGQGTRMEPTAPVASFNVAGAMAISAKGKG